MNMETLEYAKRFHGHLGPFLVLGLRMGNLGREQLGGPDPVHSLEVLVELENRRPLSCAIDGIQLSSGCTLGKGNIRVRAGKGISALFQSGGRSVRVSLREGIMDKVLGAMNQEGRAVAMVMETRDEEIFEVAEYGQKG